MNSLLESAHKSRKEEQSCCYKGIFRCIRSEYLLSAFFYVLSAGPFFFTKLSTQECSLVLWLATLC